jgi:hypothetical protein
LGEDYRKQLNTKQDREYRESSQIRKEHRAEIRKIVEPYSDFTILKDHVQRTQDAHEIIEGEGVSYEDDPWRAVAIALAEDHDQIALSEILKTPEQQKLYSLYRPLFATKELGGSNPSTREVLMTLAAFPSYAKSREANLYISELFKGVAQANLATGKAMRSLRDKPATVSQFQESVEKKVSPVLEENKKRIKALSEMSYQAKKLEGAKPEAGQVFVFIPNDGSVRSIPVDDLDAAIEMGAMRFNAR